MTEIFWEYWFKVSAKADPTASKWLQNKISDSTEFVRLLLLDWMNRLCKSWEDSHECKHCHQRSAEIGKLFIILKKY